MTLKVTLQLAVAARLPIWKYRTKTRFTIKFTSLHEPLSLSSFVALKVLN